MLNRLQKECPIFKMNPIGYLQYSLHLLSTHPHRFPALLIILLNHVSHLPLHSPHCHSAVRPFSMLENKFLESKGWSVQSVIALSTINVSYGK